MKKAGTTLTRRKRQITTTHINKALTDALNKWKTGDPTEVDIIFQASISRTRAGSGQYRVIIKQQEQTYP
jgi:hypothetical protein